MDIRTSRTTHMWESSIGKSGLSVTTASDTPTKSATEITSAMVQLSIAGAIAAATITGIGA
ncbi:hypothetical protein ACRYCC_32715 [Actinomadura scrupuli]|uniref:hypothetical protein n=1 Tax=Actinomadura scrupuli TaxID=559629 RepID=UPI003D96ED54